LADLYKAAGGEQWRRNDNWLVGDHCTWYGVECSNITGRVRKFSLYDNLLAGTISSGLTALNEVEYFALSTNKLSGSIPTGLGSTFNRISYFDLRYNFLSGAIPESIGEMTSHLTHLVMGDNKLSGDFIPINRNMQSLQYLDLGSNLLTGAVPDAICDLKNMSYCALATKYHTNMYASVPACASKAPVNCVV